ncbi:MAG: phosphoribosylglycinamide formyltransferase [Deltaproteobacteria bacterium]|nr:MAG: phosphoribosylglycinamide formyltransferase [Deltaproteobacteria bacterium]
MGELSEVPVGVLISGSGTNLQALLDACAEPDSPAKIAVVISNRPGVYGLERAREAGVPTVVAPHRDHPDRRTYDAHLVSTLRAHHVQWVALAGFMRLVTSTLLDAFPQRVLNIHPSLLPAFPGLDAQGQANAYGTTVAGATVHLVDEGMDHGPILAQGVVPAEPGEPVETLKQRILQMEHRLFPMVLRWAVEGRIQTEGRLARIDLPPGQRRWLI